MRYMLIHTDDPSLASGWDDEARASAYSWIEKVNRSGVGLQGSPVRPSADATTIKIRDGELVITDGPYAETKERGPKAPSTPGLSRRSGRIPALPYPPIKPFYFTTGSQIGEAKKHPFWKERR